MESVYEDFFKAGTLPGRPRSSFLFSGVWGGRGRATRVNLAVGGDWPGAPSEKTVFPSAMEVDYVRVYEKIK